MAAGMSWLWVACSLGAVAVAVLRYAWSLPRRSTGWNGAGWAILIASVLSGWQGGGAWGVSVAALVTMGAASIALAAAGLSAPKRGPKPSDRGAGMLPPRGEPRRIVRRVITFLLVIPGGLAASIGLGFVMRDLGSASHWSEANANVAALYTVPIAWGVLAVILLMQVRRLSQLVTLLACALASAPFLLANVGA
jgi:hypothetical protein